MLSETSQKQHAFIRLRSVPKPSLIARSIPALFSLEVSKFQSSQSDVGELAAREATTNPLRTFRFLSSDLRLVIRRKLQIELCGHSVSFLLSIHSLQIYTWLITPRSLLFLWIQDRENNPKKFNTPPHTSSRKNEAAKMSAEHTYKFNVSMSCGGCSGAVNRVLGKLDGSFLFLPVHTPPSLLLPSHYPLIPPAHLSSLAINM